MNRKGDAGAGSKAPYYLVFSIFLLPLIVLFIIAARAYIDSYVYLDAQVIEESYAERVFSCLGVRDADIERTYLQIDVSRLDDDRMDKCFSEGKRRVQVTLEEPSGRVVAGGVNDVLMLTKSVKPYKVVYRENGVVKPGVLKVSVSDVEQK